MSHPHDTMTYSTSSQADDLPWQAKVTLRMVLESVLEIKRSGGNIDNVIELLTDGEMTNQEPEKK